MRMSFRLASTVTAVALSATVALLACSGSDSSTPTPADAGSDAASSSSSSTSSSSSSSTSSSSGSSGTNTGGDCTPLTQQGASVDVIATKADQPQATGGTPAAGTYVLTKVRAFAALFGEGTVVQTFGAYTIQIGNNNGTTFEQVVTDKDGNATEAKGKLVIQNTNEFTATPDCENPAPDGGGVTTISGTFSIEGTNIIKMYVVRQLNITAELTFERK